MQGSFWKMVTLVGMIGIGIVAALEVNNRLKPDQDTSESDEELIEKAKEASEKEVTPQLSEPDFEKMFSEDGTVKGLSEPGFDDEEATVRKGDDEADSRVDLANLTDGNPFKLEEEAVQPGRPMIDNKIQPVGLTQEEDDPLAILAQSDSESDEQGLKPFNRNTELKSTPGDGDGPDFAAFGDDDPTADSKSPTADGLKFFTGDEEDSESPSFTTDNDEPARSVQSGGGEELLLPEQSPFFSDEDSEGGLVTGGSEPDEPGTIDLKEFERLSNGAETQSGSELGSDTFLEDDTSLSPKDDAGVPQPREPSLELLLDDEAGTPDLEGLPEFPGPDMETGTEPSQTDSGGDPSPLPFIEDIGQGATTGEESPGLNFTVPGPEENDTLGTGEQGGIREFQRSEDSEFPELEIDRNDRIPGLLEERASPRQPVLLTPPAGATDPEVMRPNLVIRKIAPESGTVGTPLEYQIVVSNDGDAAALDVVVEDEVGRDADVLGTRPGSEIDRQAGKLIWKFASLEPGNRKEITVRLTPTAEGTLDGAATVRFKARVRTTTVVTAPRLRLKMEGPREVRIGEEVAYRYTVTNDGTGEAKNVFVRTLLPESKGFRHPAGNDLEYKIESLKPNEQREITLVVVASEPGEHRTSAELSTSSGIRDQSSWKTNIVGAQLTLVRRGPRQRFVGRAGKYENIVSNETSFDAMDARVVEQIPEGMEFVRASSGGVFDPRKRSVTWALKRVASGGQETLQIELKPVTRGRMQSTVTVFENAGLQSDDHVSTTVVDDLHNVGANITQLAGPVAVGETFGFKVSVDNRGTGDATAVQLKIEVPQEIQVIGAGSQTIPAKLKLGNMVEYTRVVRIPSGRRQDFDIKLKGRQPLRNGVVKATIEYDQMDQPLIVSESVTVFEE